MVLKKILKLNNHGTVGFCIPAEFVHELDLHDGDYMNVEIVGNALHFVKVVIQ